MNLVITSMLKKFNIQIPLPLKESFDLLCKSGTTIPNWKTNKSDLKTGYIEWQQSFFSLTGTALITAILKQTAEKETSVEIAVHKALQFIDPLKICDRVFDKLDKSLRKNL